jgi:hypothetical protein
MKATTIFLVYDGIENSIFDGQVIQPALQKLNLQDNLSIYIVSFERDLPKTEKLAQLNSLHQRLTIVAITKGRFWGSLSIVQAANRVNPFLQQFSSYSLVARGPLAGLIAQRTMNSKCTGLILQARGLLAQEYVFAKKNSTNIFKKMWHYLRTKQLHALEKKAYSFKSARFAVEAVSPALREYLKESFKVTAPITIADSDIPHSLSTENKIQWNTATRTLLNICPDAIVYCYNGSIKPWQCPEKVIEFFKEKNLADSNSFLLILTQDTHQFEQLLNKYDVPKKHYYVRMVKHHEIYRYLAACNVGILFREKHIINWVSRPTKALEYKAAGLTIIHNNTVACLVENSI